LGWPSDPYSVAPLGEMLNDLVVDAHRQQIYIALGPSGQWFYYEAVNSVELYRIPAEALADPTLPKEALEAKIEHVAQITMWDGMYADPQDRTYLTDVEHSAIMRMNVDRKLETVFKDPQFRWPTAFSLSPDGYIYFSCNALQDIELRSRATIVARGPFHLFRFRP
jgi:sugar lactone lactonase YvrE